MNAARIRALVIVGVLLVASIVLVKITISDDKQSHASYTNSCPAGTIAVVTDPLPDHLKVFEAIAERDPGKAEQAMSELIELARMDTPISRRQKSRRAG